MTPAFERPDPEARSFFDEHGYVVFTPQLSPPERAVLRRAFGALLERYAAEQGLTLDAYLASISQWRDLWRCDAAFRGALEGERLWSTAAYLMGKKGAQLLHDHVIMKPARASGTVPWHQDYPYWPVDTAEGLSCWCPLEDVGPEGGCLEVIDGSHRFGEAPPADFIAGDHGAFDAHPGRVRLPVPAGSIVALQSLTWHRSGPNVEAGQRIAYISLWLPTSARYAPDHSRWHPVNEHVTVKPGERLNADWFPVFGEIEAGSSAPAARGQRRIEGPFAEATGDQATGDQATGDQATSDQASGDQASGDQATGGQATGGQASLSPPARAEPQPPEGLSMFNAGTRIADQLRRVLERSGLFKDLPSGVGPLLALPGAAEAIARETLASGVAAPGDEGRLLASLEELRISSEAYRLHRARNVYNGAYVAWWRAAGEAWDARLRAWDAQPEASAARSAEA